MDRVWTFRLCRRRRARAESPVHDALPLHVKYPNPNAKSGPDGKVSAVTGSQKSRSKPSDKGKTKNGNHLLMALPAIAGNASSRGGVAVT